MALGSRGWRLASRADSARNAASSACKARWARQAGSTHRLSAASGRPITSSAAIEVTGTRLSYLDWGGAGPPALLLHGITSSAATIRRSRRLRAANRPASARHAAFMIRAS